MIIFENYRDFYDKSEKYKKFFSYFSRAWMGNKIPKSLWNYHELLLNPNNYHIFHVTNNITENINRYLNNKLKKAIFLISYSENVYWI